MESKKKFENLPYREALAVLRELERNEDADFLEFQVEDIMKELGIGKEELEAMDFKEIEETLTAYYVNLQNQLISQFSFEAPVSMQGNWLAGANAPPELIEKVTRLQAQQMEDAKARMGLYG